MKRIFTILIVLSFVSSGFAQLYSSLTPTLIVWKVDGQKYSLRRAAYGVSQPEKLTLEVYFKQSDLQKYGNIALEFRWYYYLSTRRKFVKSEIVRLNNAQQTKDGAIKFSSTLQTVTPGWWEVQIVSLPSRKYIKYANLTKYQIFVRRQMLVRR